MFQEYSADTQKHFNHTQIHKGVCVTRRCSDANHTEWDQNTTLAACLNDSIWRNYKLQAKLNKIHYCESVDDKRGLDSSDLAVIIVYMILLAFNVIGSLYDVLFYHPGSKSGKTILKSVRLPAIRS